MSRNANQQLPNHAFLVLGLTVFGFVQMLSAQASPQAPSVEPTLLTEIRQITFEGRRAGEGYFSQDGSLMVFQSERRPDNPFFQIYLLDFETGDVEPISPGYGKTTCAWVHPENNRVLFSSTQSDPEARAKQKQEIEFRESGETRRYSWDYDETYEIFAFDRTDQSYQRLTDAPGYDAEGSYSPDGKQIAFASNRNAYQHELSPEAKKKFETDPAHAMEIFLMNADGSNVRQLTDTPGYDGGPFFSPDGTRICWRRFSENGVTAEIMTMKIDGSDQQPITKMGAMSWAPFYHPSGEYLIFTTNKHGFANFELYLVATDGKSTPVRVTDTDGFDGLASFTPDGKQLTWTSNRNAKKESQIYLAKWNHEAALAMLKESSSVTPATDRNPTEGTDSNPPPTEFDLSAAAQTGIESAKAADPDFDPQDIMRHVDYLCRQELGGRFTGSVGEKKATAYVAAYLDYLGLQPAGDDGSWFQQFEFPAGAEIGPNNKLTFTESHANAAETTMELEPQSDWRPLTFSGNVDVANAGLVFAGYGIVAPEIGQQSSYDSYGDLDVADKWVLVFRFVPEDVSPERRQHLQFYAGLRKKAFYAREKGALGLIVVSGPNPQVRQQLVPLQNDFSPSGSSLAAISVTDQVAQRWLSRNGRELKKIQDTLDDGVSFLGFEFSDLKIAANLNITKITGTGRNVIGRMQVAEQPSELSIIVGAHIDHLGTGKTGSSLAKEAEQGGIHFGADDNASGVAAMLEIAEYLASQKRAGKIQLKHDIIFAGWSGEELGLHGSQHFVDSIETTETQPGAKSNSASFHDFTLSYNAQGNLLLNGEPTETKELEDSLAFIGKSVPDFVVEIQADSSTPHEKIVELKDWVTRHGVQKIKLSLSKPRRKIMAALNMDMIGRLEDKLILQGISSSDYWPGIIESKNAVVGLPLSLSGDTDLPTDASSFYQNGIPILSAFTGSHTDYHTPRDTPEKLNYPEAARVAKLMGLITRSLASGNEIPNFIRQESKPKQASRGGLRAYLGSVPSYGDDVVGVKLSDVTAGGPADIAGLLANDIIVGLAGKKVENIYDYTAIIDALKIGQETTIVVTRDGSEVTLKITPISRQ
jgi:Tol biopolymer transport system component/Zn-dependent M28 family amino/carboxypeptidase